MTLGHNCLINLRDCGHGGSHGPGLNEMLILFGITEFFFTVSVRSYLRQKFKMLHNFDGQSSTKEYLDLEAELFPFQSITLQAFVSHPHANTPVPHSKTLT